MARRCLPIKILVSQMTNMIRKTGREDLMPYIDRLNNAAEKGDAIEISNVLHEFTTSVKSVKVC